MCLWISLAGVFVWIVLRLLIKCIEKSRPPKPGSVSINVLSEGEGSMLTFVLVLPEKSASDVESRELTVSVAGGESQVFSLSGDETTSQEFDGEEGDVVSGSLVDIDNAGNRSEAREFSITLVDTIAPPQPGEVGVKVVSES